MSVSVTFTLISNLSDKSHFLNACFQPDCEKGSGRNETFTSFSICPGHELILEPEINSAEVLRLRAVLMVGDCGCHNQRVGQALMMASCCFTLKARNTQLVPSSRRKKEWSAPKPWFIILADQVCTFTSQKFPGSSQKFSSASKMFPGSQKFPSNYHMFSSNSQMSSTISQMLSSSSSMLLGSVTSA